LTGNITSESERQEGSKGRLDKEDSAVKPKSTKTNAAIPKQGQERNSETGTIEMKLFQSRDDLSRKNQALEEKQDKQEE
jgi:hypothetical protein